MKQLTVVEPPSREGAANRASDSQQAGPHGAPANGGAKSVEDLSAMQLRAVTLLAAGKSVAVTAAELTIDRSTIHRWKHEPAFMEELHRLAREMQEHINSRMLSLAGDAMDTVENLLASGYPDRTRVAAAALILKHVLKN